MPQDQPLTFPAIEAPTALTTGEPPSLTSVALAPLNAIETAVAAMAEKYRAVAFDCATTKGMADAKAARLELRERGRYAIQRAIDTFKKEANGAKKAIEGKGDELIATLKPIEDAIDAQIKAEEDRKAAEKAAAEERERKRKAAHQAGIDTIKGYLEMARGMPSDRIRKGIVYLSGLTFGQEWEEFLGAAIEARDTTLTKMSQLCEEVAQREATDAENEQLRAQVEAMQKQMAAQNAPVIEQARIDALITGTGGVTVHPDGSATILNVTVADGAIGSDSEEFKAIAAGAKADIAQTLGLPQPPADCDKTPTTGSEILARWPQETRPPLDSFETAPWVMPQVDTTQALKSHRPFDAVAAATVADEKPTVKLGEICEWLGFAVRADFLADVLHIEHRATDKAAKLYFPSDRLAIGRALIAHIGEKLAELGD